MKLRSDGNEGGVTVNTNIWIAFVSGVKLAAHGAVSVDAAENGTSLTRFLCAR
ncbi:hypothetical protein CHELA20_52928 [Hyphomicrobiales bacterium]|nr:hypothetical protein CHELA41_21997 [Hyphomicrobiales bacterium]CAH1683230.1 hypothetical protein CHELA20_52928 [Hyphomicrobiales bacterium]